MKPVYFIKKVIDKFSLLPKSKHCNICNRNVYDFLPLPDHYQKNFVKFGFPHTQKGAFETIDIDHFFCPQCYSMDRERLYAWYIKNKVKLDESKAVLDLAPSVGLGKWIKNNYTCQYTSADLFMDGVDVKTDIEDMNVFADETFDFVICSHIMEHVQSDVKAMKEIFRVMKKGAQSIIMTPILKNFDGVDEYPGCTDIAERWRRFGQDDHIRLYSQKVFTQRLKSVGFELEMITAEAIDKKVMDNLGIPANFVLYIAKKY